MHWNGHTFILLMAIKFYKSPFGSNLSRGINAFLSDNQHLEIFAGLIIQKCRRCNNGDVNLRVCVCLSLNWEAALIANTGQVK